MKALNKFRLSLVFGLIISSFLSVHANKVLTTKKGDKDVEAKIVKEEEGALKSEEDKSENKPIYYELIHEMLRPDANEFYLSTIYGTAENPRALIKRSQNLRAGELYNGNVEYGVGEKIADDLVIVEINFDTREVVVQDTKTKDYYGLKLSYGNAVSRLVKKPNYIPIASGKQSETQTEKEEPEATKKEDEAKAES